MGQSKGAEIYGLYCPDSGQLRYIGKANNSESRLKTHIRDSRRKIRPVCSWIKSLVDKNKLPDLKILEIAEDWQEAERRWIALSRARGDRLLNLADGGDRPNTLPTAVLKRCPDVINKRRKECLFEYTRHRVLQHSGFAAKGFKTSQSIGALEKHKAVKIAMAKIARMDKEDLFWAIFSRPSSHYLLPESIREDAQKYWALV